MKRRELLKQGAAALGATALGGVATATALPALTQGAKSAPVSPPPAPAVLPPIPDDPTKVTGAPTSAVGTRSRFVTAARTPVGETQGSSLTPLGQLHGTITPADLHFERHHAGVPTIDPARHQLVIHGLVNTPMVFTVADLQRFPAVTRTHFIECSGNGRAAYRDPKPEFTAQKACGLIGNSEWIGVPLATLFQQVGVKPEAKWFLAEGSDACVMTRSIPIEKAWDDAMVVWGQNGEPLRPEAGYPLRLLLPGWEGNTNIKWLRRLELGTAPWMTRWETSKYTDPLPGGKARQFSFEVDARSIITTPSVPAKLEGAGWWPISGVAWSGRGTVARVEVSTDNGATWHDAELQGPVLPKAMTRFVHPWKWDGKPTTLLSRATDSTGYVQPTRDALRKVRGPGTDFHFNHMMGWNIAADGTVTFHGET